MKLSLSFARFISIALHPFVTMPLAVALATRTLGFDGRVTATVIGALAIAVGIVGVYATVKVARGEFSNIDVSERTQRPRFYAVMILATIACALLFHAIDLPQAVVRGTAISAGLLVASWLANYILKVSLHVAYTVFSVAIAWSSLSEGARGASAVICLLMVWSRIEMRRHTPIEAVAGGALGAIAGWILHQPV